MPEPITWMHDPESRATEGEVLQLLYALVSATKPEFCVETGTHTGKGTQAISKALVANNRGWLETVESDPELVAQYKHSEIARTAFIADDSLDYALRLTGEVNFAFIDCGEPAHRTNVAHALRPKMAGLLLVHDTVYYPELLVDLWERIGPCSLHLPTIHGLAIWQC